MNGKMKGLGVVAASVLAMVTAAVVAYWMAGKRARPRESVTPGEMVASSEAAATEEAANEAATGPAVPVVPSVGKFTVSRETTSIVGPLRGDGTVDYVAAWNARFGKGVTPETNAFTGWLEVMGADGTVMSGKTAGRIVEMCGARPGTGPAVLGYFEILKRHGIEGEAAGPLLDDETKAQKTLWREEDFPMLAEYLKGNAKWLDRMAGVWERPRYWMPFVAGDGRSMWSVLLPSLGIVRSTANALCERATLRASEGDFAGFLSDVMTVKRMGRHLGGGTTIIERLVGIAVDNMANQAIGAAAGAGVFSREQCAELEKALDGLAPIDPMWNAMNVFERWSELDIVQMTAAGGVGNEGLVANDKELAPLMTIDAGAVDWDVVLRRFNEVDDAYVAAMKTPGRAANAAAFRKAERKYQKGSGGRNTDLTKDDSETREEYTDRVGRWMTTAIIPSISRAGELWQTSVMTDGMARAVVAAAEFKAEKGAWPGTLEEVVPGYLKEVPVDIYSMGETNAVKYVRGEGGVRVYSVGRNQVDDGGVEKTDDIVVGWRGSTK